MATSPSPSSSAERGGHRRAAPAAPPTSAGARHGGTALNGAALATAAETLLAAHHREAPLLLPNVWDAASAKLVEAAGFPVVATSSRAVAQVLGEADDDSTSPEVIFEFLARIAHAVSCPVTADLEAGYGHEAGELARRLLAIGVVGCNLEDSDHHGAGLLLDAGRQVDFLSEVRAAGDAAGVHLVLNARVDTFIRHAGTLRAQFEEALRRGRRYLEAGADCVYPIMLADAALIGRFVDEVDGPVNILARRDGPSIAELTALGVRRISLASGLFQLTLDRLRAAIGAFAERPDWESLDRGFGG